jgi:hypothetical protein
MAQGEFRIGGSIAGAVVGSALLLSGCADGIALNGKVFDWMGVSPAAQEARTREPKIAERAPLVMPPSANRLPEPGSGAEPTNIAFPDDPEQRKAREGKERERLHMAYCRGEIQWKERAFSKSSEPPRSPYGPCPTLFGDVTSVVNNKQ